MSVIKEDPRASRPTGRGVTAAGLREGVMGMNVVGQAGPGRD